MLYQQVRAFSQKATIARKSRFEFSDSLGTQKDSFDFGSRAGERASWVAMPIATVDENDFSKSRKNEVRPAGQTGSVQPETVAARSGYSPDEQFGFCVLGANEGHSLASLGSSERVHSREL